jgi:hypothetical protein
MSVKVFRNPEYREFHSFKTAATVWLASSAVCDVVIAVGMTHALVCFAQLLVLLCPERKHMF